MTAKVIPLVDQRAASRVPVIPVPAPVPGGTLADAASTKSASPAVSRCCAKILRC